MYDDLRMAYIEMDVEKAKGVVIDLIDACVFFTFTPYPSDRVVIGVKDEKSATEFLEKLL